MRILFITPQSPYPARQGTQIRNYQLVRAAATTHQVDLLSFARPGEGSPLPDETPLLDLCGQAKMVPEPRVRPRWTRLRTLLLTREPDLASRLASRSFAATLECMLRENRYDVVQVEGLEMAGYIQIVRSVAPNAAIVFDDHNVEHLLQARAAEVDSHSPVAWPKALYSAFQWRRLKTLETQACVGADRVLAVSKPDADALAALIHDRATPAGRWAPSPEGAAGASPCLADRDSGTVVPITVVPNCIDGEYYRRESSAERDQATLLFTGTMDYRPNVDAVCWFASAVLPKILARRPEVRFAIVGRSPAPTVSELGQRFPGVQVVGAVEDIRPYFSRSTACVVPIRIAGGARLKILEAMAMELPVVSTTMGAEGIDLREGREILLADTGEAFANTVLRLLDDPALRRQMGAAGRRVIDDRYCWDKVAPRLLDVYASLPVPIGIDMGVTP